MKEVLPFHHYQESRFAVVHIFIDIFDVDYIVALTTRSRMDVDLSPRFGVIGKNLQTKIRQSLRSDFTV